MHTSLVAHSCIPGSCCLHATSVSGICLRTLLFPAIFPLPSSCRDETTVVAFNGLGKVMRAHMPTVLALPGINEKWDEVCKIASQALMSGRKSVAVSAAQLVTGFLQVCWHGDRGHGFPPQGCRLATGSGAPRRLVLTTCSWQSLLAHAQHR